MAHTSGNLTVRRRRPAAVRWLRGGPPKKMEKLLSRILPRSRRARVALAGSAGALLLAGGGARAAAAVQDGRAVIHACVDSRGATRIIDTAVESCRKNET